MLLVNIAYCKNDSWLVNYNWAGRTINNDFPNVQIFPEFGGSCNWHVPGSSVYELLHKRFWFLWVTKLWIQGYSHTWPRWVSSPCTWVATWGDDISWVARLDWWLRCDMDSRKDSHWAGTSSTETHGSCPVSFSVDWSQVWPSVASRIWRFGPRWPCLTSVSLTVQWDNDSTGLFWGLNKVYQFGELWVICIITLIMFYRWRSLNLERELSYSGWASWAMSKWWLAPPSNLPAEVYVMCYSLLFLVSFRLSKFLWIFCGVQDMKMAKSIEVLLPANLKVT